MPTNSVDQCLAMFKEMDKVCTTAYGVEDLLLYPNVRPQMLRRWRRRLLGLLTQPELHSHGEIVTELNMKTGSGLPRHTRKV